MPSATRYNAHFQLARLTDRTLGYLLDCLTEIDCEQLEENPNIPLISESGVRYYHEDEDDPWMDTLTILAEHEKAKGSKKRPIIDCEDLACWRAAELRIRFGYRQARPVFTRERIITPMGPKQYVHILVEVQPGQTEDISRILGMTTPGLSQVFGFSIA